MIGLRLIRWKISRLMVVLFISLSVDTWALGSPNIQVMFKQPQILRLEHAIRLERHILCNNCEQEEYYEHCCLKAIATVVPCCVALLESP